MMPLLVEVEAEAKVQMCKEGSSIGNAQEIEVEGVM